MHRFAARAVRVMSLLLCAALLVAWNRSYQADYAFGWQSRRVSRSQGGRWEYRLTGFSARHGVVGVGTVQERSGGATTRPVTDYRYVQDGWTGGVNSSLWREPLTKTTYAGFGLRRVNVAPFGNRPGYVGWVLMFPIWLPLVLCAWPIAEWQWGVFRDARRYDRVRRGLCPICGYDLRGTSERCPECGARRSETWPTTA
jgi:hypothetical protein